MHTKSTVLCFAMLAGVVSFGVGCPNPHSSASTITLYVANLSGFPIDRIQILNQQTQVLDDIAASPVAPLTMQVFHLPKLTYSSPSARLALGSTTGGFGFDSMNVDLASDKLIGAVSAENSNMILFPTPVLDGVGKALDFPAP